ncbi:MAG TPA: hypothetical protein VIK54_16040, partial [Acidimicrobiia bacterium]
AVSSADFSKNASTGAATTAPPKDAATQGPAPQLNLASPKLTQPTAGSSGNTPAARSTDKTANGTFSAGKGECTSPPQLLRGDTLVLRATATLSGKPVVVLVFTGNGEHTVVVDDTNCRLLNLQMLG